MSSCVTRACTNFKPIQQQTIASSPIQEQTSYVLRKQPASRPASAFVFKLPKLPKRLSAFIPKRHGLPRGLYDLYGPDFDSIQQGHHCDIFQGDACTVRAFALRRVRTPFHRDFSLVIELVDQIKRDKTVKKMLDSVRNDDVIKQNEMIDYKIADYPPSIRVASPGPPCEVSHPKRFSRRDELLASFLHPKIVSISDIFENSTFFCVVTEKVEGPSLPQKINHLETSEIPLTEEDAAKIFVQILSAINHLHEHSIIHRHLTSHKFVFKNESSWDLLLVDFTHCAQLEIDSNCYVENDLGPDTALVGGMYYQAPEVLTRRVWSKSSDIWSMGVILYEIVFGGCMPFFGRKQTDLRRSILVLQPDINEDEVSPSLAQLLSVMLSKEPGRRSTVSDLLHHPWIKDPNGSVGNWTRKPGISSKSFMRLPMTSSHVQQSSYANANY